MKVIIGLGNHGKNYEHTRHNVGFDVLSIVATKINLPIVKRKYQALVGEGWFQQEKVLLATPQTYMNNSGMSIREILDFYQLAPEDLLVVYDDVDLPLGKIRIRRKGSGGTHNGMRSIIEHIHTQNFPRIRVGIGEKPSQWDLADWVLSKYDSKEEREIAFSAYLTAADAAIDFITQDIEKVMQKYNHLEETST
ncbi:MAG: aminoacyl-tRNA hydrolase [Clostridiales bacterium]|nr:aminoacyl-tRNA hydrolase [Clostridiales bacterium]